MRRDYVLRRSAAGPRAGEVTVSEVVKHCLAQMPYRAFLPLAVERHEQADVIIGEQVQVAVHPLRVTAMTDYAMAVVVLLVESQQHAVEWRHHRRRAGVHLLCRLGLQNSLAVV